MSFWYDFTIACNFEQDTPQQVIDTLTYMTRTEDYPFDTPPDHPYFDEENEWRLMFQEDPALRDIASDFRCTFRKHEHTYFAGNYVDSKRTDYWHTLNVRRCMIDDEFHNYPWWELLEWLAVESSTEGFVGYFRCEFDWKPALILFQNKTVYMMNVEGTPVPLNDQMPSWDEEKTR